MSQIEINPNDLRNRRELSAEEWGVTEPLYPRKDGFKKAGAKNTKGHELVAAGELEIVKVGRATRITGPSIVAYLNRRRLADNPHLQTTAA